MTKALLLPFATSFIGTAALTLRECSGRCTRTVSSVVSSGGDMSEANLSAVNVWQTSVGRLGSTMFGSPAPHALPSSASDEGTDDVAQS